VLVGDGCWEFTGALSTEGYGKIGRSRREGPAYAHRVAFELFYGPIYDSLFVCHRCDNRRCVRPDHLFIGTQGDNMRDCRLKGRTQRGEGHYLARFTDAQVIDIRNRHAAGEKVIRLARAFGVERETINFIVRGETWKHL